MRLKTYSKEQMSSGIKGCVSPSVQSEVWAHFVLSRLNKVSASGLSDAFDIYSSTVVSLGRLTTRHHHNNASLGSITRTYEWMHLRKGKKTHTRTQFPTCTHTHTAQRCFKSTRRIGYDYCGYRNCYHRLPSQPLSAVRSLQLSALFTLMWAVGNIAERRLP